MTALGYGVATGTAAYAGYKLVETLNTYACPTIDNSGTIFDYHYISDAGGFGAQESDGSYAISKNDPGTPQSRETQQGQADDAKKEIEKLLDRKLTSKERGQFHNHVSGQNYGYHEMVEEGYWLFGGK